MEQHYEKLLQTDSFQFQAEEIVKSAVNSLEVQAESIIIWSAAETIARMAVESIGPRTPGSEHMPKGRADLSPRIPPPRPETSETQ